ncbi:iron-sulfur cluster repair di-iron protein [Cohnella phaseoli]|uniref:Regulator of cell morphogenesis and NO signaling n=1 Tax=Cohnella phaseoli TaxID=456490 RepID=A0A3D9JU40_9BACL|nr:iron-sulfur cluster repair di-iron protein [Cohnella phaseoli]RED77440.1 regulator of cell morphogenesis and NO signaling [Cohnella phaseoli]
MSQQFNGEEKIGDIVADFPGASHLFKETKIDFCCGGDRPLAEAARGQQLDLDELLRRLNESYEEAAARNVAAEADWKTAPIADLIDHIVTRHHGYLKKELPLISELLTKVLRVHGAGHPELAALHRQFHQMKIELDQHLIAEEEALFPLLKRYAAEPSAEAQQKAVEGLDDLEQDHSVVGDYLKEMRAKSDGYALPAEACTTYSLAFGKLVELEADLFEHIHLENNVLFPRVEQGRV